MTLKFYVLYFIAGGFFLCGILYAGSLGKGYAAAFLALLPVWTIFPMYALYHHYGIESALHYAQGLIMMTVPWLLYVSIIVWFVPYVGFWYTTLIGFIMFVIVSGIINWLRKL